jgi:type I restriction-modification system DNA methylase subunit
MTSGKNEAYQVINDLVSRFEDQAESYKRVDYNETMTRRDFIDPFFKALGWDVDNSQGYAEAYREVIHEDRVRVGKETKAPDYSFRLPGGKRLFFVEAKKPSVQIKTDEHPAYQVRRYGWSAKLAVSLITDFEELSVYDCTKRPLTTDKASSSRIKYLHYKDYMKEFDFIWDTFSKERVLKGGFDKYIKSDTVRKGTATVDKEFLLSLDEWRTYLAVSISKNNPKIQEDELNYVVQQTIDRIVFLRISEDRGVEPYGKLRDAVKHGDYYKNLLDNFREADEKYNSGLFDFRKDRISQSLSVDNKTLKGIISEMYYPVSPYEFSVLSVEILGNVYEQFLGKQITLDEHHKVKIEEKPEVRKAGGVYYTPEYIVEYIVKNTVGKLIDGKTPKEISKIKIVDPACGSGSFLLGAFQYLLNYHRDYYNNNPVPKSTKEKPITPDGNLTTAEKKRILINNIFGVDIDVNAVEVTKLSLLLKCMEGETDASITNQFKLWNERVLPTLDDNIKSGNSLVDVDYYDSQLDFGEEKKVKPFSWKDNFKEVFKQGGFDAVIGNPPYVRQELLGVQKEYFAQKYKVYHGMADLYSYFFERGTGLLKDHGLFGIIVANKWMRANYGAPLRNWLKNQDIQKIVDFGDLPVFQGVSTYPCIIVTSKGNNPQQISVTNVKTLDFQNLSQYVLENSMFVQQTQLNDDGWSLASTLDNKLLIKLQNTGRALGSLLEICYGIKTGFNEAFVIDVLTRENLIKEDERSKDIIKPFLAGRDVKRYEEPEISKYLIFTKRGVNIDTYPAIKRHLLEYRKFLEPKPKDFKESSWDGRKQGTYKWFEIQDAVDYWEAFSRPKIIVPCIVKNASYTYDTTGFFSNDKTCIIPTNDLYLLGLLNSSTLDFFLHSIASTKQGGYFEYKPMYVSKLPVKVIDPKNKSEVEKRDEIVKSVELVLSLKKDLKTTRLESSVKQLQTRIDHTEKKIDSLVYELYGLTPEEIKIVETTEV